MPRRRHGLDAAVDSGASPIGRRRARRAHPSGHRPAHRDRPCRRRPDRRTDRDRRRVPRRRRAHRLRRHPGWGGRGHLLDDRRGRRRPAADDGGAVALWRPGPGLVAGRDDDRVHPLHLVGQRRDLADGCRRLEPEAPDDQRRRRHPADVLGRWRPHRVLDRSQRQLRHLLDERERRRAQAPDRQRGQRPGPGLVAGQHAHRLLVRPSPGRGRPLLLRDLHDARDRWLGRPRDRRLDRRGPRLLAGLAPLCQPDHVHAHVRRRRLGHPVRGPRDQRDQRPDRLGGPRVGQCLFAQPGHDRRRSALGAVRRHRLRHRARQPDRRRCGRS